VSRSHSKFMKGSHHVCLILASALEALFLLWIMWSGVSCDGQYHEQSLNIPVLRLCIRTSSSDSKQV